MLNDRTYNILKKIALIWLPALSTCYFALATIWGLPYAEQIVGTLAAIDTFLGAILGLSKSAYQGDGTISVGANEDGVPQWSLKMNIDANDILSRDFVTIKVEDLPKDDLR